MHVTSPLGIRSFVFGTALWASGVGLVRIMGETMYPLKDDKARQAAVLAATIPLSMTFPYLLPVFGIPKEAEFEAMVMGSAAACLWDGYAVFFTNWYSDSEHVKLKVGSTLLWGIGVGLLLASNNKG
ncbi:hypothetical protein DFJ74DRAFT_666679 [Hyaloraphidium curvatum]|nr:hypothetical protein DFJ74DRAFT_666679 [Hyaloraphidium curvatum]